MTLIGENAYSFMQIIEGEEKMKIELELNDFETLLSSEYDYEDFSTNDFKNAITELFIDKIMDKLYDSYVIDTMYDLIKRNVSEYVNSNKKEITDSIIDKVSGEVIKKKSIVAEMPKKSEINTINKEWENYFVELIDKAIAKRFK